MDDSQPPEHMFSPEAFQQTLHQPSHPLTLSWLHMGTSWAGAVLANWRPWAKNNFEAPPPHHNAGSSLITIGVTHIRSHSLTQLRTSLEEISDLNNYNNNKYEEYLYH